MYLCPVPDSIHSTLYNSALDQYISKTIPKFSYETNMSLQTHCQQNSNLTTVLTTLSATI